MRLFAPAAAALMTIAATPVDAQTSQPLRGTVKQRSYLDPGPVAPVGRYQNYVYSGQYLDKPTYFNNAARFGSTVLPPRIGGGYGGFCCF